MSDYIIQEPKEEIIKNIKLLYQNEKDTKIYDKILFLFSLIVTSKTFKFDDNAKKICEKFNSLKEYIKETEFQFRYDLFAISTEENLKEYLLQKVFEVTTEKDFSTLLKIVNKKFSKSAFEKFCDLIHEKKLYHLIKNPGPLLEALSENKNTENEKKLLFFLKLSSLSITDKDIEKLEPSSADEKNILDLIIAQSSEKLFKFDYNVFDKDYGVKSKEELMSFCKQVALRDLFLTKTEISFKEIEDITKLSFDDLEENIVEGEINGMFKLKIDYSKKAIIILFVRKTTFTKDDLDSMNKNISDIKSKIGLVIKALDSI